MLPTTFTGVLSVAGYATSLDALIDFSSATYEASTSFFLAAWCQATSGSGKVYRAQYRFQPSTGILPSVEPSGVLQASASSTFTQPGGAGGQQFLLHCGGIGALVWGIDMTAISLSFGVAAANLWVSAIAHGRELSS